MELLLLVLEILARLFDCALFGIPFSNLLGIQLVHLSLPFLEVSDLNQIVVQFLQLLVFNGLFSDPLLVPRLHYSPESRWVVKVVFVYNLEFLFGFAVLLGVPKNI